MALDPGIEPLNLLFDLDDVTSDRWENFYARPQGHLEEGIWRRTQAPCNAEVSGWGSDLDQRRKLVHYELSFRVFEQARGRLAIGLAALHLHVHLALPRDEAAHEMAEMTDALRASEWSVASGGGWRHGALRCEVDVRGAEDVAAGYEGIDVIFSGGGLVPGSDPWFIMSSGFRQVDLTYEPILDDDLARFPDFAPYTAEIGSGLSMESGLPPLYQLHELYGIHHRDGRFDFRLGNLVHRLVRDKSGALTSMCHPFIQEFHAKPGRSIELLGELVARGVVVEPILSHNFDRLLERSGLKVERLRRFDLIRPVVPLPSAGGLLVVGLHADRRGIRAQARERGLKVYFIDPERLPGRGPYPLEGVTGDDLLCRRSALDALSGVLDGFAACAPPVRLS